MKPLLLEPFDLGGSVLDVFQLQEELVGMFVEDRPEPCSRTLQRRARHGC